MNYINWTFICNRVDSSVVFDGCVEYDFDSVSDFPLSCQASCDVSEGAMKSFYLSVRCAMEWWCVYNLTSKLLLIAYQGFYGFRLNGWFVVTVNCLGTTVKIYEL